MTGENIFWLPEPLRGTWHAAPARGDFRDWAEAITPLSLPDDDFDDDAIRRELMRIVRDYEKRILSDFEAKKSEIRADAASLGEESKEAFSTVLESLEAASTRMPAYFLKMREFIERQ